MPSQAYDPPEHARVLSSLLSLDLRNYFLNLPEETRNELAIIWYEDDSRFPLTMRGNVLSDATNSFIEQHQFKNNFNGLLNDASKE